MAVLIKIRPNRRQTKEFLRVGNACGFGNLRKSAVSVIVIERVGQSFQSARTALHVNSVILTGLAGTEYWKVFQADIDVVGDEKVSPTIRVIITKSRAGSPPLIASQAGLLGHVSECAVAIISVQHNSVKAGDQQIGPAIIVVIADGDPHCPTGIPHASLLCDIGERAVVVVVIKGAPGPSCRSAPSPRFADL